MTSHMQRVHYSILQFRPNPADESRFLALGIMVGFQTEKYWAVGMATRAGLPSKIMDAIDPLSRAMLENRAEIVSSQVAAQVDACSCPEDVISVVARENFTSFFMTPVRSEMVDMSVKPSEASMERLAEEYVLSLFHKRVHEAAQHRSDDRSHPSSDDLTDDVSDAPLWMSGTQVWMRLAA